MSRKVDTGYMGTVAAIALMLASLAGQQSTSITVLPPRTVPAPDPYFVDLPLKVFALTGESPRECGRFQRRQVGGSFEGATRDELQGAVRCAQKAIKEGQPFWTYTERRGIDSWVADGLLRTATGELRFFSYDASPCGGGPGCESRLHLEPCGAPAVKPAADGDGPNFTCRR